MAEPLTATQLRSDIYRILDHILETGEPREVVRKGGRILLVQSTSARRRTWEDLPPRPRAMACSFDELVATRWDYEADVAIG